MSHGRGRSESCRRSPGPRRAFRLAALTVAFAPLAGCQWFPLRHAVVEPESSARPTTVVAAAAPSSDRPAEISPRPADSQKSPPVPPGVPGPVSPPPGSAAPVPAAPTSPAAAAPPATPLLDSLLSKADPGNADTTGPTGEHALELPPPAPATRPGGPAEEPREAAPKSDPGVVKASAPVESAPAEVVVVDAPENAAPTSTEPRDLPPMTATPVEAETAGTVPPEPAPKAIDPEKPVPPVANRDDWADNLAHLREHARRRAGEPSDAAEAWAIRARVLDWLAGDGTAPPSGAPPIWDRVLAALATATAPETADESVVARHLGSAVEALESFAPLQVRVLALCGKIHGFGQYEPLDGPTARAGKPLLVYCEMTGLTCEPGDDGYRSRLASRVEITPTAGGPPAWSRSLGTADDLCRSRRRDFYANYRLTLPATLPPGPYSLRLTQTDLLSGRSIGSSVEFTLQR